jgi:hypothetical protein
LQCRHCLNRPFNLQILGTTSDVTVYVPSNFQGFISYANTSSPSTFQTTTTTTTTKSSTSNPPSIRSSPTFTDLVLPNAHVNMPVPRTWQGDQITVATGGRITFRVWDVFEKRAEVVGRERRDVWRKVFFRGVGVDREMGMESGRESLRERRTPSPPTTPTWNWDFLLDDE